MLMVVFGAGASYDSVPSRPPNTSFNGMEYRPPRANELFDDRPQFVSAMLKFPQCQPIIPNLRHREQDVLVEHVLEEFQAQAEQYPKGHNQLAAIRWYLHFMLWECQHHWKDQVAKGVTNYRSLLDRIQRWRKAQEKVCLLTFNYDTMLEDSLPDVGVEIRGLSDYIANENYKVIKLHGSINWAREVNTPIENLDSKSTWDVARELIDRAADLDISRRYRIVTEWPIGKQNNSVLFPALAIPVETKADFECPSEQLETLQALIPEVTKLLVIGWRATENRFLELMVKNLRQELSVMIVAGSPNGARETTERLQRAGIKGQFHPTAGGFTELVVRREGDEFLRSEGQP